MHTHTCDCIALMKLQSESIRINSLPKKISSTRNKWACRTPVAAPHLTMQEAMMQKTKD